MPRTQKYHDWLKEKLKNHDQAIDYLNNALDESLKGDEESLEILLMAIRNVVEAQGGIGKIAKKTHLVRESLYKTLSKKGNPQLRTLISISDSTHLKLRFA